uniref:Putative secreted protein n=1 Tax=Anopheles darlingi TaxID=43151 RepID=A0A2M4D4J0_ANODA
MVLLLLLLLLMMMMMMMMVCYGWIQALTRGRIRASDSPAPAPADGKRVIANAADGAEGRSSDAGAR